MPSILFLYENQLNTIEIEWTSSGNESGIEWPISGNESGIEWPISGNESGSESVNETDSFYTSWGFIFILLSPLLLVCFIGLCASLYIHIQIYPIKIKKYFMNKTEKGPIIKGQLNPKFIKKLNVNNYKNINKKNGFDCSICIESINLEKINLKKNNVVILNCHHVYHTNCLQPWVKSQVAQINKPNCPLCREIIIEFNDKQTYNYNYDNYSDYSDYSD